MLHKPVNFDSFQRYKDESNLEILSLIRKTDELRAK